MKVLYFDCFSGVSGDMMLGALLDLGIDKDVFKSQLSKLNLQGYEIIIDKKNKNGISATDVYVLEKEDYPIKFERHLEDILEIIDSSGLNENVKNISKKVFDEIATAEGKVHGKKKNEVHFHEVGAIDSIIDIVGVSICIDMLKVDVIYCSPLKDGKGFIECMHGLIPVPVPAVMEILANSKIPLITEDINTELVTPTGAALVKCLAQSFGTMPSMTVDKVGYGLGKRDTGKLNALRVVMGMMYDLEHEKNKDEIVILDTNIDDTSPHILGYVMDKLFKNGALDVFYTNIHMKKNRTAVILSVIANITDEQKMVDIIFKETSSIGVRRDVQKRYIMDRRIEKLETQYGIIRVKVASIDNFKKIIPEYEDCKDVAKRTGIPLWKVYEDVKKVFNIN